MRKKMNSRIMAAALAMTLAAGCSLSALAETVDVSGETMSAEGLGGYKIGFWYMPESDLTSKAFHDTFNYCAELTNCEMVYYDMTAWSSDDVNTAVESLVSSGCDGIINVLGYSASMFEYLNDSEVYYVGLTRSYNDEIAKVTDDSEYCVGWVGDLGGENGTNAQNGYDLTQVLADEGCKKIAIVAGSEGETMNDERVAGVKKCAEDNGMEVIAEYRGGDFVTGYSDILAAYGSELDGIACTGGGDNGVAAIQQAGLSGQIKLVQIDPASEDTEAYMEAGLITATLAGGSAYMYDCYMQLFNALSGADRLFDEGSKIVPQFSGFVVSSAEEWNLAQQYTSGDTPGGLTPNEILAFNSLCYPGLSVEEREAMVESMQAPDYWNIEGIQERVGAYRASK